MRATAAQSLYCAKSTRCYLCECGNVVLEPATLEHHMFSIMLKCSSSFIFFNTAFVYISIYLNFSPVSIYRTRMYRLSSIYRSPVNNIALQRKRTAEQHSDLEAMCSDVLRTKRKSLTNLDRSQQNPPQGK